MNTQKNDTFLTGKKKSTFCIIVIYGVVGIILPIVLKYAVFENTAYSLMSNEGWASFLGSYIGGVLGGIGTLIAMYLTIRQTTDIQRENKKDTDERIIAEDLKRNREYTQQLIDRRNEKDAEILAYQLERKKEFTDGLAEIIGKYITHISYYDYSVNKSRELDRCRKEKYDNYMNVKAKYESLMNRINKYDSVIDSSFLKLEVDGIKAELGICEREYYDARREYESNIPYNSKIISNNELFTIKAKLINILESRDLINQMDKMDKEAGNEHNEVQYGEWMEKEGEILLSRYWEFRDKYVRVESEKGI